MSPRWLRRIFLLCFFISGATGLVFEVLWGRYLSNYLGGTTLAHTLVLGTFMGGLALGNALVGRWVDRIHNRILLYAGLELGIGLLCLGFPEWFSLLSELYVRLGATPDTPGLVLYKAVLAIAAMLPACVLIGGTLPALAKAITGQLQEVGLRIGQVYFINTAGALLGVYLGGFVLLERFGVEHAIRGTALVNIALGLLFLALARGQEDALEPGQSPRPAREYPDREIRLAIGAVFLGGFLSMTLEVVWIRLLAVVFGSSTYSFSVMLLSFISGICLGSLWVSALMRDDRDALPLLIRAQAGICLSLVVLVPFYEQLPYWFMVLSASIPHEPGYFSTFLASKVLVCMAVMVLPTTFIGMTLPLVTRMATRRVGALGKSVGSVFSINTVGTLLGASVGGLLIMPALGLEISLRAIALANGAIALGLWWRCGRARSTAQRRNATVLALVVLIAITAVPRWDQSTLIATVFRLGGQRVASSYEEFKYRYSENRVLFHEDGRDVTVVVLETPTDRSMLINGKADASARGDLMTQRMLGHLGMLLNPTAQDALVIGLGSGITVRSVRTYPDSQVDVVEIAQTVVKAARQEFGDVNGDILDDPLVKVFVGDAKDFLKLQPDRKWDLIVSEPSNPWIAGIGGLFTQEYWREVYAHLNEGGIFVQWVQGYEMDDALTEVILQTFGSTFEHTSMWEIDGFDYVLLASKGPLAPDYPAIARRLQLPSVQSELRDPVANWQLWTVEDLLSLQLFGAATFQARFPGEGQLNTDDHPVIEFLAPRSLFRRKVSTLPGRYDERRRFYREGLLLDRYLRTRPPLNAYDHVRLARLLSSRTSPRDAHSAMSLVWQAHYGPSRAEAVPLFERAGFKLDQSLQSPCATVGKMVRERSGVFFQPAGTAAAQRLLECAGELPANLDTAEAWIRAGAPERARPLLASCDSARCWALRVWTGDPQALTRGLAAFPNDVELRYLRAAQKQ